MDKVHTKLTYLPKLYKGEEENKNLNGQKSIPNSPTYQSSNSSQNIKLKIDPRILHELSLGPGVDQAESYPSSGARNSKMGPRPRENTCIESRQGPIYDKTKEGLTIAIEDMYKIRRLTGCRQRRLTYICK